jgi:hypothetical protein
VLSCGDAEDGGFVGGVMKLFKVEAIEGIVDVRRTLVNCGVVCVKRGC